MTQLKNSFPSSPVVFNAHSHSLSQAKTNGGAIYYTESINWMSSYISIVSSTTIDSLQTLSGSGALFYG